MDEKEEHYTAVISIHRGTETGRPREVAKVVVRSKTLAPLIVKAQKHLELVEEN